MGLHPGWAVAIVLAALLAWSFIRRSLDRADLRRVYEANEGLQGVISNLEKALVDAQRAPQVPQTPRRRDAFEKRA